MNPRPFFLCLASIFPFLTARAADPSAVVAHIGKTEIRASEIQLALAELSPHDQTSLTQDPAKLAQFVRSILVQRVVLEEALAKKWDQQPSVLVQLKQIRDNKIVDTYLQSVSQAPGDYPDETAIQNAYQAARPSLLTQRQYRLGQIFIAAPKSFDATQLNLAQHKMEQVQKELQKPNADFGSLATLSSDDHPSAERGGEIGWLTESQVQPELRSQFTSLAKGDVSPPLRLLDGWHFLKCMDIKEPFILGLPDVRTQLIQQLRNQRAREVAKAYVDKLVETVSVTVDESALANVTSK